MWVGSPSFWVTGAWELFWSESPMTTRPGGFRRQSAPCCRQTLLPDGAREQLSVSGTPFLGNWPDSFHPHLPKSCQRPRASRLSARVRGWSRGCRIPAASPPAVGNISIRGTEQVRADGLPLEDGLELGSNFLFFLQIYWRNVLIPKVWFLKECLG